MIRYVKGDMFESGAQALVNTVNLEGVMGKGVALQFKQRFAENFRLYQQACRDKTISIGHLLVTRTVFQGREVLLINFPTKTTWRQPSEYLYVQEGLVDLCRVINAYRIDSIAIPPLGAGNGGLDWIQVRRLIENGLQDMACDIMVYEPASEPVEVRNRQVALTPARALLVYMLHFLQEQGEVLTEFSGVKMAYFLQKFGAEEYLKLKFEPYVYGPYNHQVKYILQSIDGAYVVGFADLSKKSFEPFGLIEERFDEVRQFVEGDLVLNSIVRQTIDYIRDFSDEYHLELLSSVDYLRAQSPLADEDAIFSQLEHWNKRKARVFTDRAELHRAYTYVVPFVA